MRLTRRPRRDPRAPDIVKRVRDNGTVRWHRRHDAYVAEAITSWPGVGDGKRSPVRLLALRAAGGPPGSRSCPGNRCSPLPAGRPAERSMTSPLRRKIRSRAVALGRASAIAPWPPRPVDVRGESRTRRRSPNAHCWDRRTDLVCEKGQRVAVIGESPREEQFGGRAVALREVELGD